MNATRQPTEIKIYWNAQDYANEGWAFAASDDDGVIEAGPIAGVGDDDLDGAIEEACRLLDVDVRTDSFAREPRIDGGFAIWNR